MELEFCIEIRRDRMRLIGDDASKIDFGIFLGAIDFVHAVWILFGQGQEVVDTTSSQCGTGVNRHAHNRTAGVVRSRTKLKLNMWEVAADGNGHRFQKGTMSKYLDVVPLDIDDEDLA